MPSNTGGAEELCQNSKGDKPTEIVSQVDDRITLLTSTFTDLILELTRERNSYLPVNRLVDDLLLNIWSYTELSDRFAVSKVSNRWRHLALSTGSLWTLIDLERCDVRRLRCLLNRSGSSPLHMVVACKDVSPKIRSILDSGTYSYGVTFPISSLKKYNIRCKDMYGTYITPQNPAPTLAPDSFDFITQKEFDGMVGRCITLDTIVGVKGLCYVRTDSAALSTPMPYLRTLRLIKAGQVRVSSAYYDPHDGTYPDLEGNIMPGKLPFPLFDNIAPLLQELCFEYMSARWDDPIYRNLTNLRVYKPQERAPFSQLLQILRSCPNLTDLDLTNCLLLPTPRQTEFESLGLLKILKEHRSTTHDEDAVVPLHKLKYLCFQEWDHEIIKAFLASLSLRQLKCLHLGTAWDRNNPTFTKESQSIFADLRAHPLPSLLPTITEPQYLRINCNPAYMFLEFQYKLNESDRARIGDWAHHGSKNSRGSRPKPDNIVNIGLPPEECGKWNYLHHSLEREYNTAREVNVNEWTSVTYNISLEPTPGASPPFPTRYLHGAMDADLIPTSHEYIRLFRNLGKGNVQFAKIHTLQIDGGAHCPDFFYRGVFSMCSNVRTLRMNYDKGVGILAALVKDHEDILPMLEEVYLGIKENNGVPAGVSDPYPEVLADWVEKRQSKASEAKKNAGQSTGLRPLKKLSVRFYYGSLHELVPETRKRIVQALGETGEFSWTVLKSRKSEARGNWLKAQATDNPSISSGSGDDTSQGDTDTDDVEELISGHNSQPIGWSAGPW